MDRKLQPNQLKAVSQDPIEILKNDHHGTLQRLELIERTLQYLESLPSHTATKRCKTEQSRMRDRVNELSEHLRLHFIMEEEALFPTLSEYVGKEHGPIEMILQEHSDIRAVLSEWKSESQALCKLTDLARDKALKGVARLGYHVIGLLRLHISKENQILFKICEVSFSEQEKSVVTQKLRLIEANYLKTP